MTPSSRQPMPSPELSLVLPCYNEAEILERSLAEVYAWARQARFSVEVIFVDDASTDSTPSLLHRGTQGWNETGVRCQVLRHPENRGRGAAVRTGLGAATGSVQGFLDIDFEIPLANVARAYEELRPGGSPRFLVARRVTSRENLYGKLRSFLSLAYARLVRSRLGLPLLDTEAGFKFFTRACNAAVVSETTENGWYWDTEVCLLATRKRWALLELACPFTRRHDKTSKVRIYRDVPVYLWKILRQKKKPPSREEQS